MERIDVDINTYSVISSGSVIVPQNEKISFSFMGLRFVFEFDEDKDDRGNLTNGHFNMRVDEIGNGSSFLRIILFNQEKSFYSSTPSMIPVATHNGKQIYLKFAILSINRQGDIEDKIFYYTWYEKQ